MFTSRDESIAASISSDGGTEVAAPPASKAEQAKALLARYGSAYLLTSISFAIVSFATCYFAVEAGVDVAALLARIGLQARVWLGQRCCRRRQQLSLAAHNTMALAAHDTMSLPQHMLACVCPVPRCRFRRASILPRAPDRCRSPTRARRWAPLPWPTQPTR